MAQKKPGEEDNQQKRRTMSLRSGTAVNKTVATNTQGSNKRKQRKIQFEEPITNENFDPQSSTSIQQNPNQQRVPQVIPATQLPPIEEQQRSITPGVDHYETPAPTQTAMNINEDTTMLEQPSSSSSRKENNPDIRNKGKGPAEQRPRPIRHSTDADGDTEETDEETTDDTEDYTSFESDYIPIEFYLKDDRVKYPLQLEEWTAPNGTTCYHVYTGESLPLTGNETTYLRGELPHTNSQELRFYPYPALYQPYEYQETSPILPGQTQVEIEIDNPRPDPIELPYNTYLGDYIDAYHTRTGEQEEELDDDEIAEIYGYDYNPYRYIQLRRQGTTNDQDLFMNQSFGNLD
ncbi:hypothetical protein INT45_008411 [Circinella minor]|uniref:Uncharacterized protein n=1 Tax=Circinella minor TaxID=1195481 RepID=A0A8H7RRJ6_9FUNG|nr:hypothetical protein INT45_008411 [Circinella minor]